MDVHVSNRIHPEGHSRRFVEHICAMAGIFQHYVSRN